MKTQPSLRDSLHGHIVDLIVSHISAEQGLDAILATIKAEVEKLEPDPIVGIVYENGYNRALVDVLELLS